MYIIVLLYRTWALCRGIRTFLFKSDGSHYLYDVYVGCNRICSLYGILQRNYWKQQRCRKLLWRCDPHHYKNFTSVFNRDWNPSDLAGSTANTGRNCSCGDDRGKTSGYCNGAGSGAWEYQTSRNKYPDASYDVKLCVWRQGCRIDEYDHVCDSCCIFMRSDDWSDAGSFLAKRRVNETVGTLRTDNVLFVFILVFVVYIFAALTFFPALALGPIAEHLVLWMP